MTKGALQRVARRGDGWIAMGKGPDDIKAPLDTLRELTLKAGRSPDSLQINMLPLATPSLDQVIKDIPRYSELGVQHRVFVVSRVDGKFLATHGTDDTVCARSGDEGIKQGKC